MSPHQKRLNLFETKEQYLQLKVKWAETKQHSAFDHSIYNILRGHSADRGFTSISRPSRINNGHAGAYHDTVIWQTQQITARLWEDKFTVMLNRLFGDVINLAILRKAYVLSTIPEGEND